MVGGRPACALAVAALLAGCGDGGRGPGVPDARDYRTEAERICVEGNADARELSERLERIESTGDRDRFFPEVADITRDAVDTARPYLDRLDALERPPDDADELAGWIADQRRRLVLLDDLADAFEARDEKRIAELAEDVDVLEERLSRIARRYGMPGCAATL